MIIMALQYFTTCVFISAKNVKLATGRVYRQHTSHPRLRVRGIPIPLPRLKDHKPRFAVL